MAAKAALGLRDTSAREQTHAQDVLVVGPARSGTTWVARTLGLTDGSVYISEPDEAPAVPFATRARSRMGMLPVVEPGDDGPELYRRLWDVAFSTRRRSVSNRLANRLYAQVPEDEKYAILHRDQFPVSLKLKVAIRLAQPAYTRADVEHRIVRSVQVPMSLEWLVERIHPHVVLVRRHPLDIVASRVQLGFLDFSSEYVDERGIEQRIRRWDSPSRPFGADAFSHLAWLVGFEMSAYDEVAAAHPEYLVVEHEEMCADPLQRFRRLVDGLGLTWTEQCDGYLRRSDTPGTGFDTKRVASQQSGKWHTLLSSDQVRVARGILRNFPVAASYPDLVA